MAERERERERESKRFWGRKRTCASVALFGHVFAKSSATLWQSAKVRPRAATEGRLQSAASASASLPMETAAPPSRSRRDALTPSACVSLCLSASLAVSLCVSLWFSLSPSPALSLSLPLSLSLAVSTQRETPPAPRASSSRRLRPQAGHCCRWDRALVRSTAGLPHRWWPQRSCRSSSFSGSLSASM